MAVTYNRPANLKYTDMCIYIDNNLDKITQPGRWPQVEQKIYEYLYHITYALAYKSAFFNNFEDYDLFALDAAGDLYMYFKRNRETAGTIVRGKEVVPVKSCLNFIKSILYPFKVNYTRKYFSVAYNPEVNKEKYEALEQCMIDWIEGEYSVDLLDNFKEVSGGATKLIKETILNTPYKNDRLMVKRLYLSCILTFINDITLPNKIKNKINSKKEWQRCQKFLDAYTTNTNTVILWHLPEYMRNYVLVLLRKVKRELSEDLEENSSLLDFSEGTIDDVIHSSYQSNNSLGDED